MDCATEGDVCNSDCMQFNPMDPDRVEPNLQQMHFDEEGIAGYIHRDKEFSLFGGDCDIRTNKSIYLAESDSMNPAACCQIMEIGLDEFNYHLRKLYSGIDDSLYSL